MATDASGESRRTAPTAPTRSKRTRCSSPPAASRAVQLADDAMRKRYVITAPYPRGEIVDRFAEAARAGARYVISDTLPALIEQVAAWGVPAAALRQTLDDYRRAAAGERVALDAPL